MQWLFDHGAQEDVRTPTTMVPHPCTLQVKNNVEAMQWLFDHGAQEDVRTPDNDGSHPCYCKSKNNVEAMQWLFDHGAKRCSNTRQRWCHTHVRLQVTKTTWKQCSGCLIMVRKRMFEHQTTMVSHPCGLQVKKQRGSNAVVV